MNQIIFAGSALLITLVIWGFGKKSPKEVFGQNFKELKLQEISLSIEKPKRVSVKQKSLPSSKWSKPKTLKEKIQLQKELSQLMKNSPNERLEAITIATLWGDKLTIPFLRKGLRDSDMRVVEAAANGMEKFRNTIYIDSLRRLSGRPPLNVTRMR